MRKLALDVPVVFIIFNRPDHTRMTFEKIAAARPKTLFVVADGPRLGQENDEPKCRESRSIVDRIDWDCELHTDYAENNQGCGRRIASGLDWAFSHVDRAIILEDDCIPDSSFFQFAAELLDKYAEDVRVRTISGSNFLFGEARNHWSYHFSMLHNIWGWATWRRSWSRVDMRMRLWPEVRDGGWLMDLLGDAKAARFWAFRFERTYQGHKNFDTWDYPYLFSCWLDRSVAITPNCNLVSNCGSGSDALHTVTETRFMNVPLESIGFPLNHPPFMVCDRISDNATFRSRCLPEEESWSRRVARRTYYFLANDRANALVGKIGRGRLVKRDALAADS